MKSIITTLAVLVVAAAIAVPTVVYSGLFNVAATWEDPRPIAWLLHSTYTNSVAARADEIQVPENLGRREQVLQGARNFVAMCSGCHTPPGQSATPVGQGLNPPPPDLAEIIPHRTPAEAFWVIDNGVRMTGMPAFGPTHKDEELWALVAFIQEMSKASGEQYQALVAQAKRTAPADDGHAHRHSGDADASAAGGHTQSDADDKDSGHSNSGHDDSSVGHHADKREDTAAKDNPSGHSGKDDGHTGHSH